MNEIMGLEQLEALAKNPAYTMSPAQIARLEKLREERFRSRKHVTDFRKHKPKVIKHASVLEEPQDGVD